MTDSADRARAADAYNQPPIEIFRVPLWLRKFLRERFPTNCHWWTGSGLLWAGRCRLLHPLHSWTTFGHFKCSVQKWNGKKSMIIEDVRAFDERTVIYSLEVSRVGGGATLNTWIKRLRQDVAPGPRTRPRHLWARIHCTWPYSTKWFY